LNCKSDLITASKPITIETVYSKFTGKEEKSISLITAHEFYNERIKRLIGKDYALGTYNRYVTSLKLIKQLLATKEITDIPLKEITYSFAADYEMFLKTVRNCEHNTSIKYIHNLKAVLNFSVDNEWIPFNPVQRYNSKLEKVEKNFLTQKELSLIENKILHIGRLEEIRDVFVFACYTGFAYSDIAKLTTQNIVISIEGTPTIKAYRTKTNVLASVPILAKAQVIIDKYSKHLEANNKGLLLPVISNQKYNAYLKELADLCGVKKTLTSHTARHTFATLMLTNGASIESVSSMLGHTNIVTTQVYAKITNTKVEDEMAYVQEKLKDYEGKGKEQAI
jgi:site-specific recombinase XerD